MSEPTKAVFLSYASQDAEAARKICEALRSGGVEVWFDQNELVGGDAWDAKIRKQISECALFVPLISANAQARLEGYFRLEWKLAAQRTHTMADEKTFLLPVLVDATRDAEAKVPAEFKTVQWTKLPLRQAQDLRRADEATEKFCARVKTLLGGEGIAQASPPAASPVRASLDDARGRGRAAPLRNPSRSWSLPAIIGGALLIAGVAFFALRPRRSPEEIVKILATAQSAAANVATKATPSTATASPASDARQLVAKARALFTNPNYTRDDLVLAEDYCQQAMTLAPNDGEVWAVNAELNGEFIGGGMDRSPARIEKAQAQAERAVKLAPDSADARFAKASVLRRLGGSARTEAEKIFRELLAQSPDDPRVLISLAKSVWGNVGPRRDSSRAEEALGYLTRATAIPVTRAEALRERAYLLYYSLDRDTEAEADVDASLALQPSKSGYTLKVVIDLAKGDVASARAHLARLPADTLRSDQGAYLASNVWYFSREPAKMLEALDGVPRDYLASNQFHGPTDLQRGKAFALAGKPEAARNAWRAALGVVEKRLVDQPQDGDDLFNRAYLLALLGELDRARAALRLFDELMSARPTAGSSAGTRGSLIVHTLVDPPAESIPRLANLVEPARSTRSENLNWLRQSPDFDPLRSLPAFAALVREETSAAAVDEKFAPAKKPAADDKSVAVLAFADLSAAHDSEYFSDGISEELLNVLAKVPSLKVSARTSAFYFKGKEVPIPEIAQQLGVAYVVEGSVRKAGNQVRITAQLIKAADGFHVWSETFTRDLKDIFAVQDEIAGLIAKNLEIKMGMTAARTSTSPEAYGLLLQGRFFARQESNVGRKQAIDFYRRAIGLQPGYALAWAEMAQAYIRLARFGGMTTADGMKEARLAAQKSLELDPDQPIALDAMGWVQRTADWHWRAAQKSFQRALALAPEDSAILADAAILYRNVGRGDEAITLARQAAQRDPLNAMAQINLADLLMQSGGLAESVEVMNRGIKLAPQVEEFRSHLAIALALLKRFTEADAMVELEPNEAYRLWGRGIIAGLRGDRAAVTKAREALVVKHDPSMTGYVAMLFGIEEKRDEAFVWLERSVSERDSSVCWIKTAIYYDELRKDARWPVLLRRLGLADDQLK